MRLKSEILKSVLAQGSEYKLSTAQQRNIWHHPSFQAQVYQNNSETMTAFLDGTKKLGFTFNKEETMVSSEYLNHGKVTPVRGEMFLLETKRRSWTTCPTNDQLPSFGNITSSVLTNAPTVCQCQDPPWSLPWSVMSSSGYSQASTILNIHNPRFSLAERHSWRNKHYEDFLYESLVSGPLTRRGFWNECSSVLYQCTVTALHFSKPWYPFRMLSSTPSKFNTFSEPLGKVHLFRVPGHAGIFGYDAASYLSQQSAHFGLTHQLPIPFKVARNQFCKELLLMWTWRWHEEFWHSIAGQYPKLPSNTYVGNITYRTWALPSLFL